MAAVATVLTLAMPVLSPNVLDKRMKSVALEREKIRQRERERLARGEKEKVALRHIAQAIHAAGGRAVQPEQVARPGGRAREAGAGRLSRPGALRRVPVLPPDHAGGDVRGGAVLPVRRPATRPAGDGQDRDVPRRRLCRHAGAVFLPEKPHCQAPALDQARIPGCARSAADLRRIRACRSRRRSRGSARKSARSRSRWRKS